MKKPRQTYHHGNARSALLEAALAQIESVGAQGLALRQVAQAAGLSRQAPYNHFADKQALLAELATIGFKRLESRIRAGASHPDGDGALAEAFDAYVAAAATAPALFRLMFSCELVDMSRFAETQAAAHAAFASLTDVVAAFAPSLRVSELSLAAWSIAHGYATLCIEVGLADDADRRAQRARLYARMIRREAGVDVIGDADAGTQANVQTR